MLPAYTMLVNLLDIVTDWFVAQMDKPSMQLVIYTTCNMSFGNQSLC